MLIQFQNPALLPLKAVIAALLTVLFTSCSSTDSQRNTPSEASGSSPFDIPLRERSGAGEPQVLGGYKFSRKVSVFYRIDLKKDNHWAKAVAAVVRRHESSLRNCYTDQLVRDPGLKGSSILTFRIERGQKGFKGLTRLGGTLRNPHLHDCLITKLSGLEIQLPPSARQTVQGTISWEFNSLEGVAVRRP